MPEGYIINYSFPPSEVHEISVDYNGHNYVVIFGVHINGGFYAIPSFWGISGELSSHWKTDIMYNAESIGRQLKSKKAALQIAMAIADYMETLEAMKNGKKKYSIT